jgi:hypothetical protein
MSAMPTKAAMTVPLLDLKAQYADSSTTSTTPCAA